MRLGNWLALSVSDRRADSVKAEFVRSNGAEATSNFARVGSSVRNLVWCYAKLGKHKLSALVVYTGVVGFAMGSSCGTSGVLDYTKMAWTTVGTGLCAVSANTLNQLYEVDRDALMSRTKNRPLPAGKISKMHALAFAVATGALGYGVLAEKTDRKTAGLGLANIALYAGVYTPLKVLHPVNTWVGAVVGAIPPMMGWSAATNGDLSHPGAWILGSLLFVWQIPHFHALSMMCVKDYTRGGYKMLSQADPKLNARLAAYMAYTLLPLGPLMVHTNMTTPWFAAEALGLNLWIIHGSEKFVRNSTSSKMARPLFFATITYLPIVLSAMVLHRKDPKQPPSETSAEPLSVEQKQLLVAQRTLFLPFPFTPPTLPCPSILTSSTNREEAGTGVLISPTARA